VRSTNKYLAAFAYLLAGSFLTSASWAAGFGLLLAGGLTGVMPNFVLFLGINLLGLYLSIVSVLFFLGEVSRWFKRLFRKLGKSESRKFGR
jgi:hypothetical protein